MPFYVAEAILYKGVFFGDDWYKNPYKAFSVLIYLQSAFRLFIIKKHWLT
jgi:hypothetical protein